MWLNRVKARSRNYYYLTVYCSKSTRKERNVYALGTEKEAGLTLKNWLHSKNVPAYLSALGCSEPKIKEWKKKVV